MIARLPCLYRHLLYLDYGRYHHRFVDVHYALQRQSRQFPQPRSPTPNGKHCDGKLGIYGTVSLNLPLNNRVLALLLLLQAAGLSLLLLVASETKNRRTAAVGKLIGNGDWPFHVCVRAREGGREGADQRRKNIKGKRGKSPNGSEQREERRVRGKARPIYQRYLFPPWQLTGTY